MQAEGRAPKNRPAKRGLQRELFIEDPMPEIRRELAEILELLK
jgi:hypothetical protein